MLKDARNSRLPLFATCHRETRPARCAAILVYCAVRDRTRFCYVIELENIRIHPSTRYSGIRYGFIFSTLESGVENIAGCVWTEAVSGKKNLRIKKYPDTCGQGILVKRCVWFSNSTYRVKVWS